jgi:hypothetical protein
MLQSLLLPIYHGNLYRTLIPITSIPLAIITKIHDCYDYALHPLTYTKTLMYLLATQFEY